MIVTTHRFVVPSPRFFVCKKRSRPEVFRSAAGRRVRAEAPRLHLPLTTFSPPSATCDSPAWRWGSIRRCVETPVRLDPSAARPLLNFAPVQRRWRVSPDAWWPKPPCVPGFASPSSFPSRRLVAPSGICFSHAVTALSHAVAAHRVRAFRAFPTLVALERFPVHCPLDITSSKARKKMVAWTTLGAPRSDPVLRWAFKFATKILYRHSSLVAILLYRTFTPQEKVKASLLRRRFTLKGADASKGNGPRY